MGNTEMMKRHRLGRVRKIMELMQLEMFVAIVEEGSMTNAARRVFRTQPAVSIALRKLEEDVGVSLFERPLRYPILLTPAGMLLHHYAKCLLALRDNALADESLRARDRRRSPRAEYQAAVALVGRCPAASRWFSKLNAPKIQHNRKIRRGPRSYTEASSKRPMDWD